MRILRRIYEWVISWADRPSGPRALAGISFAEASFFPIPPDVLLIPMAIGNRNRSLFLGFLCTISSVLGAIAGYAIGLWIWWDPSGNYSAFAQLFFNHIPGFTYESFSNVKSLYEKYNFIIIFTAGFTPIPFKLFTISAGAFDIQFFLFIVAGSISRGARFMILTILIKKYGEPIRYFIEKYFDLLAISFTILLLGGFFLIHLLL